MIVIGLTGGIGTGKTHAAKVLKKAGAMLWDADRVAREVVKPHKEGWKCIKETFGNQFFRGDSTLDRRAIAEVVFNDKEQIEKLNAALHPVIISDMKTKLERWEKQGVKLAVVDAPLLLETGIDAFCDQVWVVSCGVDEQRRRIMERDGLSAEDAVKRIEAQMSDHERRQRADRVIDTLGNIKDTERLLKTLYEEIIDEMDEE